jgi:predicted transposase YbfD/YdcC
MEEKPTSKLQACFEGLSDPRIERTKLHKLIDIVMIAICAVICGADDWVEVAMFGEAKESWFRTFLELANGVPSHDTFTRVFARLDPEQFRACFLRIMRAISEISQGQVVAIDGKRLRGSLDTAAGREAIDMVSAWASENHLVLGQVKVDDKSNEIKAVPELLKLLSLSGCLVTLDALSCQTEIAQAIVDQQADYLLSLKGNQITLYADVDLLFQEAQAIAFRDIPHTHARTVDKDHGRLEIRECWTITDPIFVQNLRRSQDWPQLHALIQIRSERRLKNEVEKHDRYFISNLDWTAEQFLTAARTHWTIENCLHWVLDIAFQEDHHRLRKDHGPENFAMLRHIALNLLKQEHSVRAGIKAKRLKAGWDESYLLKLLSSPV